MAACSLALAKQASFACFNLLFMELSRSVTFRLLVVAVSSHTFPLCSVLQTDRLDFHLPQRSGSQHGDLKKAAVRTPGLCQMPLTAFSVCGNRVYCVWKFVRN